jgi:perosamine synthetase
MSAELAILGGRPAVTPGAHRPWPDIRDEDRRAVAAVLDRGVLTGSGSVEAPALERAYATFVGARHCLAMNSGTSALHACAVAADLLPGDEVIVPAFTYVASAMAFCHHGVRPVFCDVEERTFNLDPARIEERITDRTRAIVAVHLHGLPCEMDSILQIAERHGLHVIEDVAQAHGAEYGDRRVGTFGRCAGGSLNATKNLPGGEGGLFVTDDDGCVLAARRLRYMGEDIPDVDPPAGRRYWSHGVGWNYRPHELPAAFARSQLRRIDDYRDVADANAQVLSAGLADIAGILPPLIPEGRRSVWYIYRVLLDPGAIGYSGDPTELRDRVLAALSAEGVETMLWQHHPLPAYTAFRRPSLRPWQAAVDGDPVAPWDPDEFPAATAICDRSFVLGTGLHPLAVQAPEVMHEYVHAVGKVFANLGELLDMPFVRPPASMEATELNRSKGARGAPAPLPL